MKRIGLIVNPVAGMGGSVGLKGTDGKVDEARRQGAIPHAGDRARITLTLLAQEKELHFLTCSGTMGGDFLQETGRKDFEILYSFSGESSVRDTQAAARQFRDAKIDLLLFCGGDGTARDIFEVTGRDIPLLGIPAGVKMYSAVFAIDPVIAAELVLKSDLKKLRDSEILDVDEEAVPFRDTQNPDFRYRPELLHLPARSRSQSRYTRNLTKSGPSRRSHGSYRR